MSSTIIFEQEGGVAILTLNRPEALNSFTVEMHQALAAAMSRIESDASIRAVILTGAGRGFCAGQDLNDRAVAPGGARPDLSQTLGTHYNPFIRRMKALPKPIIVAVNGVAAGAGANLAFQGDIVLAAKSAKFIQAFSKLGLSPDAGGTWVLTHMLGPARARALAMLAEPLSASQAAEWGLIWKAIDDEHLMSEARAMAKKLSEGPTQSYAGIKGAIENAALVSLSEQLDYERDLQKKLGYTPDYAEGVRAFIEKRPPVFTGKPE